MFTTNHPDPFEAVDPGDWYPGATQHVRVYRPDQRWRVTLNRITGDARVFTGSELFQRVSLTRGPSGGFVPVSEISNHRVDVFSYAVAVLYDGAGTLDRDMDELGLSLAD